METGRVEAHTSTYMQMRAHTCSSPFKALKSTTLAVRCTALVDFQQRLRDLILSFVLNKHSRKVEHVSVSPFVRKLYNISGGKPLRINVNESIYVFKLRLHRE